MEVEMQYMLWLLPLLALLGVVCPIVANRHGIPALLVVGRWFRWTLFALLVAFVLPIMDWSHRPFWIHLVTGGALWFLIESGYSWLAIKALSYSDYPLFPVFRENHDGDEWPAEGRFIKAREQLRKLGFQKKAALKAHLIDDIILRSSVYADEAAHVWVQLFFVPTPTGSVILSYSLQSEREDGLRLMTDNLFIPYGGYYPDNLEVDRRPLVTSLERLLRIHRRKMDRAGGEWKGLAANVIDRINQHQHVLEQTNFDRGFLTPVVHREEDGKISKEGRYRIWKEKWFLDYFGSVR